MTQIKLKNLLPSFAFSGLLKTALKDSSFYLISNIAVKLMSILVIPILTRSFSIEDFAIFDLFLVLNNFLVTMMTLGMDAGIAILIAESQDDKTRLSFLFVFTLVSGLIATMLIWLLFIPIVLIFDIDVLSVSQWNLLFAFSFASLITTTVFNFIRWVGKSKVAAFITFFSTFFGMLIGLLFLLLINNEVNNYLIGLFLGAGIGGCLSLYISRQYILSFKLIPNWKATIKETLKLSLPFVPNYLGNSLLEIADRIVIVNFLGLKALGIYALLSRVAIMPYALISIVSSGFIPVLLKNYKTPEGAIFIQKYFHAYFYMLPLAGIGVYLLGEYIVLFLGGEQYNNVTYLLTAMVLATLYGASTRFNGFGFIIARKTHQIAYITYTTIVINFSVSIIAALLIGLPGVIVTTLVTVIFMTFAYTYFSERAYSFGYDFTRMIAITVLLLFFVLFTLFI